MKKIIFLLFTVIIFHFSSTSQCPQVSAQVLTTNHGEINEVGAYNSFGVRITLNQTYSEDVTVTGVVFDTENHNVSANFEITVTAGYLTQQADDLLNSGRQSYAATEVNSVSPCFVSYAGVTIVFDVSNGILKFASFSDVNAVLDQLDEDYDNNYDYYDTQLDTSLSVEVLDSLDEVNGFDPRITFRNFENLFSGYNSKRAQIEGVESDWLYNDLSGTNPGDIDLTYDDAQNTICNTDYSFKIGNDLYQITSAGIYINGTLQDDGGSVAKINILGDGIFMNKALQDNDGISGPLAIENEGVNINENFQDHGSSGSKSMTVCKSNKKDHHPFKYDNETKMFELEVAIHSIVYRTGIHGKVIHFKKKNNGHWTRSRAQMAAGCGGTVYTSNCTFLDQPILRQPGSGFKKREEQKAKLHSVEPIPGTNSIWKTYSGQFAASFDSNVGSGVWTLIF